MPLADTRRKIAALNETLRNQVALWTYNLTHDRGMSLSLQRKAERAIDKSKILQKIRLKHLASLLNDFEFGNPYKTDVESEIHTYWAAISPVIKEIFNKFNELNGHAGIKSKFSMIEIPEVLDLKAQVVPSYVYEPEKKASRLPSLSRTTLNSDLRVTNGSTSSKSRSSERSKSRHRISR